MIRINVDEWLATLSESSRRVWEDWCKDCDKARNDLCTEVDNGLDPSTIKVTDLYKRRSIKEMYFVAPDGPFFRKCAYCESSLDQQHGDVDHFRPKKAVTDEADSAIRISDRAGHETDHWGYYWLAYDYLNLLPSCVECNQNRKKNLFPLLKEDNRVRYHDDTHVEESVLINPLEDTNPEEHFDIDVDTGVMFARTDRGATCIRIFGLNAREPLVTGREEALGFLRSKWQNPNKEKLRSELSGAKTFTLGRRLLYRKLLAELP